MQKQSGLSGLVILQYVFFTGAILYAGRSLFIPVSFALLISFVLYPLCKWQEQKGIGRVPAIVLSHLLLVLLFAALTILVTLQLEKFKEAWPQLENGIKEIYFQLSVFLSEKLGIQSSRQELLIDDLLKKIPGVILENAGLALYNFGVAVVMLVLIPVMSALFLYHRKQIVEAVSLLFSENIRLLIPGIARDTVKTYSEFIKGMLVVYLIVGVMNTVGLWIIGVPDPALFGFIAAIMTIIPYAGIIIASVLPITAAWITYHSFWYPLAVIAVFTVVQYLEANIIFPWAVSSKLKMNMLVTIMAIILGGILWGASGMILFIPFVSILKLISEKTPGMEAIRLFLDK